MPGMLETRVQSLGREEPLEKEMATHSSTLAWRIPWREEPGGLQSMGSQSQTRLSDFIFTFQKKKNYLTSLSKSTTLLAYYYFQSVYLVEPVIAIELLLFYNVYFFTTHDYTTPGFGFDSVIS